MINEIIYVIVAFLAGFFIKEFLLEPILGPILKYRYAFWRKRIGKSIRNPKVGIHIISKSDDISVSKILPEELALKITNSLNNNNVSSQKDGTRVLINSIKYGNTEAKGIIEMAIFPQNKNMLAQSLEIDIESPCEYKKFSEQILELSRCIEQIKNITRTVVNKPTQFTDFIKCNLNNLYEVTGILSDLKLDYMRLGNEIEVTLGVKEAGIAKLPFSIKAINKLRELVILYY